MSIKFTPLDRKISESNAKPKPPGRYAPGTVYISNDKKRILKIKEDFDRNNYIRYGSKNILSKNMIGRDYHKAINDQEILEVCTTIYLEGRGPVAGFEEIFKFLEDQEMTRLKEDFILKISNPMLPQITVARITFDFFEDLPTRINKKKLMAMIDGRIKFL